MWQVFDSQLRRFTRRMQWIPDAHHSGNIKRRLGRLRRSRITREARSRERAHATTHRTTANHDFIRAALPFDARSCYRRANFGDQLGRPIWNLSTRHAVGKLDAVHRQWRETIGNCDEPRMLGTRPSTRKHDDCAHSSPGHDVVSGAT